MKRHARPACHAAMKWPASASRSNMRDEQGHDEPVNDLGSGSVFQARPTRHELPFATSSNESKGSSETPDRTPE